jgi:hypothetical protein
MDNQQIMPNSHRDPVFWIGVFGLSLGHHYHTPLGTNAPSDVADLEPAILQRVFTTPSSQWLAHLIRRLVGPGTLARKVAGSIIDSGDLRSLTLKVNNGL